MKKIIYFICILQMTGCAYKSIIVAPRNKGDATIIYNQFSDTIFSQKANTILNDPISLSRLLSKDKNEKGTFYIFMSNNEFFIEAKSTYQTEDSITMQGTILNKVAKDTMNVKFNFDTRYLNFKMNKIKNRDYTVSIQGKRNNESVQGKRNNDTTSITYEISESQNFVIEENILELMTGEVSNNSSEPFKFIIINDLNDIKFPIASLFIFKHIASEQKKQAYIKMCRDRLGNPCQKGKALDIDLGGFDWTDWFYQKVYCICK